MEYYKYSYIKAIYSSHATTENCLVPPVGLVNVPARTVTKFSLTKGKRKTVRAVTDRFYRLNW